MSSFGTGNSMFAGGIPTNASTTQPAAMFGQAARSGLSNAGFSSNTVSPASQTIAGNTKAFGYSTLGGANRGARRGGGMGGTVGGAGAGSQSSVSAGLNTSEEIGVPEAKSGNDNNGVQQVRIVPEDEYQQSQPPSLASRAAGLFDRFSGNRPGPTYQASNQTSNGTGQPDANFGGSTSTSGV